MFVWFSQVIIQIDRKSNRFELQDDGGSNLSKIEKKGFWTEGRMWVKVQLA